MQGKRKERWLEEKWHLGMENELVSSLNHHPSSGGVITILARNLWNKKRKREDHNKTTIRKSLFFSFLYFILYFILFIYWKRSKIKSICVSRRERERERERESVQERGETVIAVKTDGWIGVF
jgi:hypothetical protein